MKKKLIGIAAFLLLLFGVVGGIAAYYTAQGTVTNVITAGNVNVDLHIWADTAMTEPFESPDGVVPGQNVTEVVTAENVGNSDAWVRVQVVKTFEAAKKADDEAAQAQLDRVKMDISSIFWTEKDGWYYYNQKLAPGEVTKPLFTTVFMEDEIDNSWQNGKLTINMVMHAVQVANNGATVMEAAGWPNT